MPPPAPGAVFPDTVQPKRKKLFVFEMPPPAFIAVLFPIVQLVTVRAPLFLMPPPSASVAPFCTAPLIMERSEILTVPFVTLKTRLARLPSIVSMRAPGPVIVRL